MNRLSRIASGLFYTAVGMAGAGYIFMCIWTFSAFKDAFVTGNGLLLSAGYAMTWPVWLAPTMRWNYDDARRGDI